MPKIVFIASDGTRTNVESAAGTSVMQAALDAGLNGVQAECGGSCSCGTCHVYVEAPWDSMLPQPSTMEDGMLEGTYEERQPNSRLSCKLRLSDALDGIVVRLPARQV